jgi:hypothetical protein
MILKDIKFTFALLVNYTPPFFCLLLLMINNYTHYS